MPSLNGIDFEGYTLEIPKKTSQLINDGDFESKFATLNDVSDAINSIKASDLSGIIGKNLYIDENSISAGRTPWQTATVQLSSDYGTIYNGVFGLNRILLTSASQSISSTEDKYFDTFKVRAVVNMPENSGNSSYLYYHKSPTSALPLGRYVSISKYNNSKSISTSDDGAKTWKNYDISSVDFVGTPIDAVSTSGLIYYIICGGVANNNVIVSSIYADGRAGSVKLYNVLPATQSWNSIARGKLAASESSSFQYVVVGESNIAAIGTSVTKDLAQLQMPSNRNWIHIIHNPDKLEFVALSTDGHVAITNDAANWTEVGLPLDSETSSYVWKKLLHTNGWYMAIPSSSGSSSKNITKVYVSKDYINWMPVEISMDGNSIVNGFTTDTQFILLPENSVGNNHYITITPTNDLMYLSDVERFNYFNYFPLTGGKLDGDIHFQSYKGTIQDKLFRYNTSLTANGIDSETKDMYKDTLFNLFKHTTCDVQISNDDGSTTTYAEDSIEIGNNEITMLFNNCKKFAIGSIPRTSVTNNYWMTEVDQNSGDLVFKFGYEYD